MLTVRVPRRAVVGRVAGVAYRTLMVHVPFEASGVVQLFATREKLVFRIPATLAPVMDSVPAPVFVIVTTLVTAARFAGMVKVKVPPLMVPLVAEVKLKVPWMPVPVSETGELVTVAPV